MLAIIQGLEEWRHYLEGARHPVEIWTNHKNLEYFQVAQELNCRQARWSLYLSHFNFTLHHKPSRSMGKPDALSRWADHGSRQGDNNNLTLLAPELFQIHHSTLELVNESVEHMALGIEEAKAALTKAKDEYAMYYNHRYDPAPVFTPGDRVWLDRSDIATNRLSSKLSHQRLGLFVIEACVGHGAYRLALPPQLCRLHPVFPVVKLSPALPEPIPGQ
jgi:hypothetical protein